MRSNLEIRKAVISDIENMVSLSDMKRRSYETRMPKFWKRASDANKHQKEWFHKILVKPDHLIWFAESDSTLSGFVIGKTVKAPGVYDPGGLTLMIDDFCVKAPDLWNSVGSCLLEAVINEAKLHHAAQVLVVCGYHDTSKMDFLKVQNLEIASAWLVKPV